MGSSHDLIAAVASIAPIRKQTVTRMQAEAVGKRYVGREQVRDGFAGVFRRFPDVHFGDARHFVSGDRGLSEWLFTATTSDGKKIEVTGCDVFTFRGDKIAVKNSYLKNRTA